MEESLLIQVLTNGVLLGLIYGLVAIGLTFIWGVMDLTNFAHGQFVMLGMYLSYWLFTLFGLDPLLSLPVTMAVFFLLGAIMYRSIIKPMIHAPSITHTLVTFGLGILLTNIAQFFWTADYRSISPELSTGVLSLAGVRLSVPQLIGGIGGLLFPGLLHLFLRKSRIGKALLAVSMDRDAAAVVGINVDKMFMLAFAIGIGLAGVSGALLSSFRYIAPGVGAAFIMIAFTSVTIGGLGSIPGAIVGGLILGLTETVGGFIIGPAWRSAIVNVAFFVVIMWRPKGLLGW